MVAEIERDLELVALSGVEDKLQHNVRGTLETLRNAGIRIWMLTVGESSCRVRFRRTVVVFGVKMSGKENARVDGCSRRVKWSVVVVFSLKTSVFSSGVGV